MAEEIKKQFTGLWSHHQDDGLPPFFEAVGALEEEKQYLLKCHPQMKFSVEGETITITNTPNPDNPDIKADLTFKLGEEFEFQAEGHLLQVRVEWEDNRIIQHISPKQSHTRSHTIDLYIDRNTDLVQMYRVIDKNDEEVTGIRKYRKEEC